MIARYDADGFALGPFYVGMLRIAVGNELHWSDTLSAPIADRADVIEDITYHFRDPSNPPSRATLRVFLLEPGVRCDDVTDEIIEEAKEALASQPRRLAPCPQ